GEVISSYSVIYIENCNQTYSFSLFLSPANTSTGMMMLVLLLAPLLSQVCCDMNLDGYWKSWKTEFSKNYSSVSEEAYRRAVWEQNVFEVMKHNEEAAAGQHTFTTGINHLSDMTTEEVNSKLNGLRVENFSPQDANENFTFLSDFPLPPSVNWTDDGFVSPVRNQGDCNACWAFSAVGALEAQMMKKKSPLVPLSVQNLIDCSSTEGNHGCLGGLVTNAFNYIINHNGISKDADYPYEEKVGLCRKHPKPGRCSGFRVLKSEFELQKVVANIGPVAVGINADEVTFHHYSKVTRAGIHLQLLIKEDTVEQAWSSDSKQGNQR
ncbi:hypothetical protein PDJAM_G00247970, partial [Pangasius djambal]|nr:hypothetical protein [Pangasius djambal]